MAWTLSRIRTKIRNLTGRPSTNQLSNASILQYVNDFYQDRLISELNLPELSSWYEFNTTVNDEDYSVAAGSYFTVTAPVYRNGQEINFYNDPDLFYESYAPTYTVESLSDGDGSTVTFTGTLSDIPIRPSSFVVDDQVETFTESGGGTLTGDGGGSGTINYTTGAYSVTFNSAPSDGTDIRGTYEYYSTGQPTGILYYDNEFVLRPVPDQVYAIRVKTSTVPTAFSGDSDTPTNDDWGPLIAYGAARDILLDIEGISEAQKLEPEYRNLLNSINRRFIRQQNGTTRAVPVF